MEKLDIARIKQYNTELRQCTEKSANLRAQLNMAMNELNRLCEKLTTELGIKVVPENLEDVYNQCVEQLNNTLSAGEEILARIKSEEESGDSVQSAPQTQTMSGSAPTYQPESQQPAQKVEQPAYGYPGRPYSIPGYSGNQAVFPGQGYGVAQSQPTPQSQPQQPTPQPQVQAQQMGQGFTSLGDMQFPGFGFPAGQVEVKGD